MATQSDPNPQRQNTDVERGGCFKLHTWWTWRRSCGDLEQQKREGIRVLGSGSSSSVRTTQAATRRIRPSIVAALEIAVGPRRLRSLCPLLLRCPLALRCNCSACCFVVSHFSLLPVCGQPLDLRGHHGAACSRANVLGSRVGTAAACREACRPHRCTSAGRGRGWSASPWEEVHRHHSCVFPVRADGRRGTPLSVHWGSHCRSSPSEAPNLELSGSQARSSISGKGQSEELLRILRGCACQACQCRWCAILSCANAREFALSI